MKSNTVVFLEIIFLGAFFGQAQGNLGKNPWHPQNFACSHTYALGIVNFVSTKNPVLIATGLYYELHTFFYQKCIMRIFFCQEGIHYCTAHKYSTESVIDASRLINTFDHC